MSLINRKNRKILRCFLLPLYLKYNLSIYCNPFYLQGELLKCYTLLLLLDNNHKGGYHIPYPNGNSGYL